MSRLRSIFPVDKPIIAMCHLQGMPGRPRYDSAGGVDAIVELAGRDLVALQDGGVDGILFCNENDLPYQLGVDVVAAATMARVVGQLRRDLRVPFGVNLLWDPRSTIAVAKATGASFVREVFTGVYDSDMGVLAPDYGEIAGYQRAIEASDVAVLANITPEFSRSVGGRSVAERAASTSFMGVDALLISGPAAGVDASMDELREAKAAAGATPVLANTGVRPETVASIFQVADGAIVGTSMKTDGDTWKAVDPARVVALMETVARVRES